MRITCSIDTPIRQGLDTVTAIWDGPDRGMYFCWEQGRKLRDTHPEFAQRAVEGELVVLSELEEDHHGGWKRATVPYVSWWQGLRGQDLDVMVGESILMVCLKTGDKYRDGLKLPPEKQ